LTEKSRGLVTKIFGLEISYFNKRKTLEPKVIHKIDFLNIEIGIR